MKPLLLGLVLICLVASVARAEWRDSEGAAVTDAALVEALIASDFVLLGEVHDNPEHHQIQARALEAMIASGRRPAVVWEMIPVERQIDIDRVLARTGPGRGAFALAQAVGWSDSGWPSFAFYSPIMKAAMDAGLPILAGGVSRETAMEIMAVGMEDFVRTRGWSHGPIGEEAREIQLDAVFHGHCGLMPRARLEPMLEIQVARDIAMAEAMARALEEGADGAVLIAGHGHVRADAGVPLHLARLAPDATVAAVGIIERSGPSDPAGGTRFNFVTATPPVDRPDPCEALRKRFGEHQTRKPVTE